MPGPEPLSGRHNIQQDTFDLSMAGDLWARSSAYARATEEGRAPLDGLAQDCWKVFYGAAPRMTPEADVDQRYAPNRPLVDRLMQDPATAMTRAVTMLDETASALAAMAAVDTLAKELPNQDDQEQGGQGQGGTQTEPAAADPAAVRQAVRAALQAANKKTDQYVDMLVGWGLDPADLRTIEPATRLELVDRLTGDSRFRRMAELVGRMRNLARRRQRNRLQRAADEIHGVETGNDLSRILPAEAAALTHPLRKLDLWRKLTEGGAMQYRLEGRRHEGRGPLVVLVDASGSMVLDDRGHHAEPGKRHIDHAKAVALALCDTARRQRRACSVIVFNAKIAADLQWPVGQQDPRALAILAALEPFGGTAYGPPLMRAMERIDTARDFRAADVVLITDGDCGMTADVRDRWMADKAARGFRVFTVLIGGETRTEEIGLWSDRIWTVNQLSDVAGDLFEEVVSDVDGKHNA